MNNTLYVDKKKPHLKCERQIKCISLNTPNSQKDVHAHEIYVNCIELMY